MALEPGRAERSLYFLTPNANAYWFKVPERLGMGSKKNQKNNTLLEGCHEVEFVLEGPLLWKGVWMEM